MDIEKSYEPHVIEEFQRRYAITILETKDQDNLAWALKFLQDYERKHKK